MKYVDFVMGFKGIGNFDSKCGVLIRRPSDQKEFPVVVISELPDNEGTSVTKTRTRKPTTSVVWTNGVRVAPCGI